MALIYWGFPIFLALAIGKTNKNDNQINRKSKYNAYPLTKRIYNIKSFSTVYYVYSIGWKSVITFSKKGNNSLNEDVNTNHAKILQKQYLFNYFRYHNIVPYLTV